MAGVTVQNIESPEIGMKSRILDRKDVGVFARFIMVGMPVTCGSDKRGPRYPILLVAVLDHPSGIKFRPDHGVATGLAADDKIQRDRFMPVGILDFSFGQESEHGP